MSKSAPQYLPDFCQLPRIAAVCGIAQLAVFLIFLVPSQHGQLNGTTFLVTSAFAQWLGLTAAIVLCKSRVLVNSLQPFLALIVAVALPASVTGLAAGLVFYLDQQLATGYFPGMHMWRFISGIALIVAMLSIVLLRYFYVHDLWRAQVQAHAKASLQALQARINPHFLFNSMNTIAALVRKDAKTAETAIEDLSDLFRAALGDDQKESTLADELQIAKQYLAIEKLRFGERLRTEWLIAENLPMHCKMPRLLLQPLFENAVIHGVALLPEGGCIQFSAVQHEHFLQFEIRNPMLMANDQPGLGHAQHSVQERLRLVFGNQASISGQAHNSTYVCRVQVPYQ
jgi:two-component system sensor histidine kinase AlgZ